MKLRLGDRLHQARSLHRCGFEDGYDEVWLPHALSRKYILGRAMNGAGNSCSLRKTDRPEYRCAALAQTAGSL